MTKLKIFLSSRVNSALDRLDGSYSLSDLRSYLRGTLEAEQFLGRSMLEIIINEVSFNGTMERDAFDKCFETMRSCHIVILLYNGEAGWSVTSDDTSNGICHEEYLLAIHEFADMTFALDLSQHVSLPTAGDQKRKNDTFARDIQADFRHMPAIRANTFQELQHAVLTQIRQYIMSAIGKAFTSQRLRGTGNSVFGDTLSWNKLSYQERQDALVSALKNAFESLPPFQEVQKAYHVIPDNMVVVEARNAIGRPFLHEHLVVASSKFQSGVLHFVAVYGNATGNQLKNLVGYPDLAVIKAPFGFYLWEKNMHIQMFFLRNCINPQTLRTRLSEVTHWLNGSREQARILVRAKARYSILAAVNRAKATPGI